MTRETDAIIPLYQRHAAAFVKRRGQHLFERPWLDRFLNLTPAPKSVLDIGCGFGLPIAAYLAKHGAQITGIDASPPLIATARDHMPEATWLPGDMRRMKLGQTFDGLLAWNSFFHLCPDDQRRMIPIFAQHARPGAALLFTAGPRHGVAMGEFEGEPLYHASLDPDDYDQVLRDNGFRIVSFVAEDPVCQGHTVCLAQFRAALAPSSQPDDRDDRRSQKDHSGNFGLAGTFAENQDGNQD